MRSAGFFWPCIFSTEFKNETASERVLTHWMYPLNLRAINKFFIWLTVTWSWSSNRTS